MKTIAISVLFIIIASFAWADDWETYEIVNRLISLKQPGEPVIHDNLVIFTADSSLRRVGIAFAHEHFATIYWYRQLLVPQDRLYGPEPFKDSGMKFHIHQVPDNIKELEYRIIVNGLWTTDPVNPQTRRDLVSGLNMSVLSIPNRAIKHNPLHSLPEGVNFLYRGQPGEIITVAGSFNGWDPFMYELREYPAGVYNITIPLPPGIYQYVFFNRGERYTDNTNPRRVYARDGSAASEIIVP